MVDEGHAADAVRSQTAEVERASLLDSTDEHHKQGLTTEERVVLKNMREAMEQQGVFLEPDQKVGNGIYLPGR